MRPDESGEGERASTNGHTQLTTAADRSDQHTLTDDDDVPISPSAHSKPPDRPPERP